MAEIKVKGIVLGGINYKEKDKLLHIFTLEKGLITCKLVGVLSANAKLKSVKEPFCFAEFNLNFKPSEKENIIYTVTSANVIESFYSIVADIEKFYAGCAILEIIKKVAPVEMANEPLFIESLKALKCIAFEDIDPEIVLAKFLISIFEAMGYALSLDKCAICGDNFVGKRYFNLDSGEIVCFSCRSFNWQEISNLTHACLRLIAQTDYENLHNLKLKKEGIENALDLLKSNFENRFETSLSSIEKFPKQWCWRDELFVNRLKIVQFVKQAL